MPLAAGGIILSHDESCKRNVHEACTGGETGRPRGCCGSRGFGVSAAKLLHKLGARVRLLDRSLDRIRLILPEWAESAGVEIVCGEHSPSQFRDAKLVVPSPGVAAAVISKFLPDDNPPEIMAETELAWRQLSGEPVLGVTGTSGKTTTTSLCAAMLKEQGLAVFTGGNIGTPLSEYILSGEKADVVVLELSSFQLQTCSTLHPRVGILLNISENHLDFHKDMDEYISAKMRLFANQTEADLAKGRTAWMSLPGSTESRRGKSIIRNRNVSRICSSWARTTAAMPKRHGWPAANSA